MNLFFVEFTEPILFHDAFPISTDNIDDNVKLWINIYKFLAYKG